MGRACTFFGHRDCPEDIRPKLRSTLVDLIETGKADVFYVGRQGAFDRMVRSLLYELTSDYPHIRYFVVLERVPGLKGTLNLADCNETLLPEGVERIFPRYAILWRNNWMLQHSDYVVTYITHSWGGAAQFAEKAVRQHKQVIRLAK